MVERVAEGGPEDDGEEEADERHGARKRPEAVAHAGPPDPDDHGGREAQHGVETSVPRLGSPGQRLRL